MTVASIFNLGAIIVTLAAVFGYVNHRWLRLPQSIGLVVIALVASFGALALDALFPALGLRATVRETLLQIEFHDTLMKGMLSFLLFAGALHVDLEALLSRKWAISMLATVGTLISTSVVGLAMFQVFRVIDLDGLAIALPYCFVFGALISPTDPIAVLSILKQVKVPASLEAKIAGESLFNDGVGIVVFTILVTIAAGAGEHGGDITGATVAVLFVQEAFGGAALGLLAGYLAYRAMQGIDEHNLEVMITLALVMATYAVASAIHVSGPIAMVIAGLFIGNHGTRFAMSEATRDHVDKFWSLLDEVLKLGSVPGDRVRGPRLDVRRRHHARDGDRHSSRAARPARRRRDADRAARPAPRVHEGRHSGADLGRPARGDLGRARPVRCQPSRPSRSSWPSPTGWWSSRSSFRV